MSVRLTRAKSNKENQTPSRTPAKKSSRKGSKLAPVALEADFDSEPFSEDSEVAQKTRTRKLNRLKSLTDSSGDEFRFKVPKTKQSQFDLDTSNSTEDETPRSKRGKKKKALTKNVEENLIQTSSGKKKPKRLKVRTTMELNQWPLVQLTDDNGDKIQQDKPRKKKNKRNTNFLPKLDHLDDDILKSTKPPKKNKSQESVSQTSEDDFLEYSNKKSNSLKSFESVDSVEFNTGNKSPKEDKTDSFEKPYKTKNLQKRNLKLLLDDEDLKNIASDVETKANSQKSRKKSLGVLLKDDLLDEHVTQSSSFNSSEDKTNNKIEKKSLTTANKSIISGEEGFKKLGKKYKTLGSDAIENENNIQNIKKTSSELLFKSELTNEVSKVSLSQKEKRYSASGFEKSRHNGLKTKSLITENEEKSTKAVSNVSVSEEEVSVNSAENRKSLKSDVEVKDASASKLTPIHGISEDDNVFLGNSTSLSKSPKYIQLKTEDDSVFLRDSVSDSGCPTYSRLGANSMADSKDDLQKSLKSIGAISVESSSVSKASSIISISSDSENLTQDESFATANDDSVLKMSNNDEKESKEIPVFLKKSRKNSKKSNEKLEKINDTTLIKEPRKTLSVSMADISEISGRKSVTPVHKLKRSNTFCVDQVNLRPSRSMTDIHSPDSSLIINSSGDTSDASIIVNSDSDISWNAPNSRPQKSLRNTVTNKNHVESSKRNTYAILDLSEISNRKSSVKTGGSDSDISWHAQKPKTSFSDSDEVNSSADATLNPKRATYNADISISTLKNTDSKRNTIDSDNDKSQNLRRFTYNADIDISELKNINKLNNSHSKKSKKNTSSDMSADSLNSATPKNKRNTYDTESSERSLTNNAKSKRKTFNDNSSTQNLKRNTFNAKIDISELNRKDKSKIKSVNADSSTKIKYYTKTNSPKAILNRFDVDSSDLSVPELNNDSTNRKTLNSDSKRNSKRGTYNADISIPEWNGNSKRNTINDSSKNSSDKALQNAGRNTYNADNRCSESHMKNAKRNTIDKSGDISKLRRSTFNADGSCDAAQTVKRDTYSADELKTEQTNFDFEQSKRVTDNEAKNAKRGTFTIDDLAVNLDVEETKRRTFEMNEFSFDFSKSSDKKLKKSFDRKSSAKRRNTIHGDTPNPGEKPVASKKEGSSGKNGIVKDKMNSEVPEDPPSEHSVLNNLNITYRNRKRPYISSVSEEELQAKFSKTSRDSPKSPRDIFDMIERDSFGVDSLISTTNGDLVLLSDSLVSDVFDRNSISAEGPTSSRGQIENQNSSPTDRAKPSGNLLSVACDSPEGRTPRKKWEISKPAEHRQSRISFLFTEDSLLNESKGISPKTVESCASPAGKSPRKKWNITQNMETSRRSRVSFFMGNDSLLNQSKDQSLIGNTTFLSVTSTPHAKVKTADKSLLKKVLSNKKEMSISKKLTLKKMPDFASIHKRAFEKMENIQEMRRRKDARAQFLLSGQKPADSTSLLHKSGAESKKQLNFDEKKADKSASLLKTEEKMTAKNKRKSLGKTEQLHLQKQKKTGLDKNTKIPQNKRRSLEKAAKKSDILQSKIPKSHVSVSSKIPNLLKKSIPKVTDASRSDIKIINKSTNVTSQLSDVKAMVAKPTNVRAIPKPVFVVPKIENSRQNPSNENKKKVGISTKSVATKSRGDDSSIQDKSREAMKGVRMNRRFDLLMKMREEKNK